MLYKIKFSHTYYYHFLLQRKNVEKFNSISELNCYLDKLVSNKKEFNDLKMKFIEI